MAKIIRAQENSSEQFRQIESDSWSSIYLPAICACIVMSVVLFVAVACSKKSERPVSSVISSPAVAAPIPAASTQAIVAKAKTVTKQRPANATYVNGNYGVSFSYPRKYSLQTGDKTGSAPVQTGFLKPGAVQIATVDMPDYAHPDTDFSSALLNVSVNPGMSAEECTQFVPGPEQAGHKPNTVKLGSNEFSETEMMKAELGREADLKYFHLFKNGACYEFALDVETSRTADEELAQVDRGQVFKQLERILSTARIKAVELPGTGTPTEAAQADGVDRNTGKAQTASVVPSQPEKVELGKPQSK
jgi:hypothetical protein